MTTYDFIFSNRPRHRLARHAAFWITWWLYIITLFYLPTQVFKGWSLVGPHPIIDKFGLLFFIKKTLIFNTLLPVISLHIAFVYTIICFLLPRYLFTGKNTVVTTFELAGILVIFYIASIGFMYIPYYHSYVSGVRSTMPSLDEVTGLTNRSSLINLPVVTSFAVMIKLVKRWWLKQKETEQLAKEKTKAELQLLKAQIHPHFLFNTLNNIYFFTLSNSAQAPEMIKKLSGMLHYILNECNQPVVPLDKEIKMIQDYMTLEKIRYGEQMNMRIEIRGDYHTKMIAPLLLIPFVENSFKHGASKMLAHPYVTLSINIEEETLHFLLINSKPNIPAPPSRNGNIGLRNVKKRLQLLYPGTYELNIIPEPDSFTVFMKVRLEEIASKENTGKIKQTTGYALA